MNVSQSVGKWYDLNKRELPWREQKNPYYIWASEIILQQTRMKQGIVYYHKFIEKFPTVFDLAHSTVKEVLNIWQGLGYYSRARNMHRAAKQIVDKFHGEFPSDFKTIRQLPGIGDYSSAAIASLAFNIPVACIDGNVYRLLARYFGISSFIDNASGKKEFMTLATELLDVHNPGRHNQAMIELGAIICLPKHPLCSECPLKDSCMALKNNTIHELPKKKKKLIQVHRYFYYLVIKRNGYVYLKQRPEKGIWALLYDFPLIETGKKLDIRGLIRLKSWKDLFMNTEITIKNVSDEYRHQLSHQIIHAWFIEMEVNSPLKTIPAREIEYETIDQYPLPRLIEKYLY